MPAPAEATGPSGPSGPEPSNDGPTRDAAPAPSTATEQASAELRRTLVAAMQAMACPAAAVLVQHGTAPPRAWWIGHADFTTGARVHAGTPWRIGSVSKLFVGTVALRLADRRALDLDATLAQHGLVLPSAGAITLRMLGRHTSGLPEPIASFAFQARVVREPLRTWTLAEQIDAAFAAGAPRAPGAGFAYSNLNTLLLAEVVERVAGRPFARVLADEVLAPLGVPDVHVARDPEPGLPHGWRHARPERPMGFGTQFADVSWLAAHWTGAAGDLVATAGDLLRAIKPLATGALLSPSVRLAQRQWGDTGEPGVRYGFQLRERDGWWGHAGDVPGFSAVAEHDARRAISVVVCTNLSNAADGTQPAEALAMLVRDRLEEDEALR